MDVFNKLYSSVSSTVSQLSGVLPGNPVTREYEVSNQISSAGIGLLWKVYNGYKKTTKQEVSVFVFEKKQLERWPKDDREMMFDILRRGIQQLTKIRHPHVLTVQHPLEESRESLAFAAEPVYACLSNLLTNNDSPTDSSQKIIKTDDNESESRGKDKKLYDVEIKHGILQLAEGLSFLHSDVKLIHRNLCPDSIIINKQGSWKIFGFDFCVSHQMSSDGKPYWPYQEYNSTWHALTQPYLEYTAPEVALNSTHTPNSDLFALGVLIYAIYSDGKPIKLFGKDFSSFRRFADDLNKGKYPNLSCIPAGLSDFVKALLHPSPEHRPKLHELSKISFFDDVCVKTLSYLDSLYQWDNLQKSKFYKGLPQIITTLPHRINLQHILPCLIKEFVNSPMIPFVLPNVLLIAEKCTKKEYLDEILPHLKPIMKLQEPIQILLIFMKKMDILLKLTPADDIKMNVLPMLYRALECNMPQVQELCLNILPTFSSMLDYNATKNALLPRIKKLCMNSPNISVKVNCLLCIGKLLEDLDKWLVLDEILPFLTQIQSREPAVLMAITGIYKIAMTNSKLGITKEIMATKIIPFLMPLSIENGLTVNQFNSIISLIKEMVGKVETEQRLKLEQLSTIQKDSGTLDPAESLSTELSSSGIQNTSSMEDVFANVKISPPPGYSKPLEIQKSNEQKKLNSSSNIKPNIVPAMIDANLNKLSQSSMTLRPTVTNNNYNNSNINNNTSINTSSFPTNIQNFQSINVQNSSIKSPLTVSLSSGISNNNNNNFIQSPPLGGINSNTNNYISTNNTASWLTQQQKPITNTISTTTTTAFNNNVNSLNSLDPFDGLRNSSNTSGNKIQMNQMKTLSSSSSSSSITINNMNSNSLNNFNMTMMMKPQNEQQKNTDAKNLNSLSQQDILDFLK